MRKTILIALGAFAFSVPSHSADYVLDIEGQHAFIQFKIKHLGYSWLLGRFNRFDGRFSYDNSEPQKAKIAVDIDVASVDSNHAARDRHLRAEDLLNVKEHPKARFVSTSYQENDDGSGVMKGALTLNGVTRDITIKTQKIGEGKDPWGGYRLGFSGTAQFALEDYDIERYLGAASKIVYLDLHIEGIRQ